MIMFPQYPACKTLKHLAEKPVDLTQELTPKRSETMLLRAEGYELCYATERVDAKVLDSLYPLATESGAMEQMHRK